MTALAPFDRHTASPAEIEAQAATLQRLADQAIDLDAVTSAAFRPAEANWDGVCAAELRTLATDQPEASGSAAPPRLH